MSSSIGAEWPPAPGSYQRLRGFYDEGVIESAQQCQEAVELFHDYQAELDRNPTLTRMSLRFIAHAERLRLLEASGVQVEAAIPLNGTAGELVLAYTAYNKPHRAVDEAQLREHGQMLSSITTHCQPDERDRAAVLAEEGFLPITIDHTTDAAERANREQQFLEMYGIFGYDLEDVQEILSNHSNTIMCIEDGDIIASTAMAERAQIPVAGFGVLNLCEITEAATHRTHWGRGLYKAVSGLLVQQLVETQGDQPVHAIYGESNLAMPGVLIAGHKNGRAFSYFDRQRYGLQNQAFGILQQNFRIEDGREQRIYNDFAVSYIPPQVYGGQS